MSKFDILENKETKKIINKSALKETNEEITEINFSIKGFPKDLHNAIKSNKKITGSVNAFVRRACDKLAKEEGIL